MNNKLAYFITKASMFGTGYFLLIKDNGKNSWISIILGTILGVIILYIYNLIRQKSINKLTNYLKKRLLGKLYIFILIMFYILLLIFISITLIMFVNSFYLINTPKIMILLPFLLLAYYLVIHNSNSLLILSNLLFYFSIFIVLLFTLLLIKYFNYTELMPIYNYNYINIIKGSLIYASITSIPSILLLNYNNTFKNTLKYYLLGSFINLIIILGTILASGDALIKIYSFPEYDVLKQIKILDFIENIENISALGWYSELFIMTSMLLNNIKNLLPVKNSNIYLLIVLITITIITTIIINGNYIIILNIFYLLPIILFIFFLLFITIIFYVKKNNT
jgi:spore germination protein KB